jgi:CheY-like chemotaxis protein
MDSQVYPYEPTLWVAIPAGNEPSRGGNSRGGPPSRRPRVLIVEDDTLLAEMYRLALSRADYDVIMAADGEAGLEQARRSRPDFAFLDIRMPRMDGVELLRQLITDASTRDMPVVMLTNYDDGSHRRATIEMGAKDYILKTSIMPGDLPMIVERWLPQHDS